MKTYTVTKNALSDEHELTVHGPSGSETLIPSRRFGGVSTGTTAYAILLDYADEATADEYYSDFIMAALKKQDFDAGFSISWYDVDELVQGWKKRDSE